MTILPQLERSLVAAATRAEPAVAKRQRRWLPVTLVALAVSGAAIAAGTQLLPVGDPVPVDSHRSEAGRPQIAAGTVGKVLGLRVPDPDGGPPWGISVFPASGRKLMCATVGRVQQGRLGVIGRDGAFGDDGRFHPLSPRSQQSGMCGGTYPDGHFRGVGYFPPVPASGYSGPQGPPVGGCRERVDLDGPTVSPQTRRRLRNVPACSPESLRIIQYGFAGLQARTVTLTSDVVHETLRVRRREDGAFLFVLADDEVGESPLHLAFRDARGRRVGNELVTPPRNP